MPSSVPDPVFGPTGFTAPQSADILKAVCTDLNNAFGGKLNLDPVNNPSSLSTPQGQIASTIAALIASKNASFLFYTSQLDPRFAFGRMQDAIGEIYFLQRIPATPTTVTCTCTGLSGTVIPVGAQVQDTAGNIYSCVSGGTIPIGGSISLSFANIVTGPVPCLSGTVTQIYSSVSGWSGVINPGGTDTLPATLGRNVETQQQFEYRRQNSVAVNSFGRPQSMYAAVFASGATLNPPNVPTDVYVVDNPSGSSVVIGGVTLLPHSIYVAAVGGDNQSIANAIFSKKDTGCDYNGNTTVTVQDTTYSPPISYNVTFQRPTALPIYFDVKIAANPNLPVGLTALVQAAIVSASTGGDGGPPMRIGSTIYSSRYYAVVAAIDPNIHILSISVGTAPSPTGTSVTTQIDQYGTATAGNITVETV